MIDDMEYMYASARIRAAEGKETAGERLEQMLSCRNADQLLRVVLELGFLREERDIPETLTEALALAWDDSTALVRSTVPDPSLYDFLLYKYDCNNIKTTLKAGVLGLDCREMYYLCGTFDPVGLPEKLAAGDTAGLPPHMAEAVREASAAYAGTGEGRAFDFCLDRACFADIAANADTSGIPLFREYTAAWADCTNILSYSRLAFRESQEAAQAVFAQAFVPGGKIPVEQFPIGGGYKAMLERMQPGMLKTTVERIQSQDEEAQAEKELDDTLLRIMNRERYKPFGAHVPAMFLVNREAELKNCRIIAAGLQNGVGGKRLSERIRTAYV